MRTHAIEPCGEKHMQTGLKTCGEYDANHVDDSICRHGFMHVDNSMKTMWRATCGDMMLKKWTVRCAVWRESYGDMMSSMRRMPCKPCGE